MTAIVSSPPRSWLGAHRVLVIVVAFAVTLAAAATFAIVVLTSSPSYSSPTPGAPAHEELTDIQKACQLARVTGC